MIFVTYPLVKKVSFSLLSAALLQVLEQKQVSSSPAPPFYTLPVFLPPWRTKFSPSCLLMSTFSLFLTKVTVQESPLLTGYKLFFSWKMFCSNWKVDKFFQGNGVKRKCLAFLSQLI